MTFPQCAERRKTTTICIVLKTGICPASGSAKRQKHAKTAAESHDGCDIWLAAPLTCFFMQDAIPTDVCYICNVMLLNHTTYFYI